ncbi:MAG: serine hydrolase domain-containing protein, partial [Planctomycetota bacterium]
MNALMSSYQLPANKFTREQPVTTRMLLRHTAGLNMRGFPGFSAGERISTPIEVVTGADGREPLAVERVPGTGYAYSGGGFTLLQLILDDVFPDAPFGDSMRTLVLEPLGLSDSFFEMPLPEHFAPKTAVGHDAEGTPIPGRWHAYPQLAAGGMWTTPTDLATFMLSIQEGRATGKHPVLNPDTLQAYLTRGAHGQFGLGIEIFDEGNRMEHGGSNEGYQCWLVGSTVNAEGIVVMTNGTNGYQIAERIAFTAADHYGWNGPTPLIRVPIDTSPGTRDAIAGSFSNPDFGTVTIEHRDDATVWLLIPEVQPLELSAEADDRWFIRMTG